jgi:hypothetical protein
MKPSISKTREQTMPLHNAFLKVNKNHIQNQSGQPVSLHGVGLGGWMNMENFITGFSANE